MSNEINTKKVMSTSNEVKSQNETLTRIEPQTSGFKGKSSTD